MNALSRKTRWRLVALALALALLGAGAPAVPDHASPLAGHVTPLGECNGSGGGCG